MKMELIGVCWLLTTECNLKCPMCYRYLGERSQLDLAEKKRIADRIAKMGVRKVTFAGGEPLLDADLAYLVRRLNLLDVKTALCTNGELLTSELLDKLSVYLDELTIPVDGSTPEIHGRMRSSPANFGVSMRLLEEVKKYAIQVDISTVVSRYNLGDLENIKEIVKCSQVPKWKVFQFYPLETGARNRKLLEISADEFAAVRAQLTEEPTTFEIDFRDAEEKTMQSYLHISPRGHMLIVDGDRYRDIGHFLETEDVLSCLHRNGFSFDIHGGRHWRDVAVSRDGS